MAKFQSMDPVRADTAAATVAWVNLVHTAMLAVGCVQTADTGQLDVASIVEPTVGTNYSLGYRVYELNDDLSANYPVYIRIEFAPRRISNTSTLPATPCGRLTVGFATDGAGNIAGPQVAGGSYTYAANTGSSTAITYAPSPLTAVCKLNGYLGVAIGVGHAQGGASSTPTAHLFQIIRTRGVDGKFNGDGVVVIFPNSSNPQPSAQSGFAYQWGWRNPANLGQVLANSFAASSVTHAAGQLVATPATINDGNRLVTEDLVVCLALSGVTPGQPLALSADDQIDRQYMPFGVPTSSSDGMNNLCAIPDTRNRYTHTIAMRFE